MELGKGAITGIREFWDDNDKAEVDTVPVRPSTTADPELMIDLVLSNNDDNSYDQSNQDFDDLYSSDRSQFDEDSEDLTEENHVEKKMKSWPQPAMCGQQLRVKMGKLGDPLWWADSKFEKFKGKVLKLDSRPEFHRMDHLKVHCGQCGVYIVCRTENNMEHFREHCRSLNKFFAAGPLKKAQAEPVVRNMAFPELSHHQDPWITQYLSHSSALLSFEETDTKITATAVSQTVTQRAPIPN
ncbi:hypothetical protein PILCRDRAFT_5305 [Piloderma croceum F 1598]|uniref:Uncharacterized protein n=1 Tax=Piloderma croceum (strain F 1598) TaxID=765440 RepID=A0A0C3G1E6_PILCF|nr:hypothetical protein PILCRDRAFT_5305 [Piloderma croceum F 1598]